jgi:hypothetical protein
MASPCRSCGAAVLWRPHVTTGKLAPIDADPHPEGNIALYADGYAVVGKDVDLGADNPAPRHRSHYATCPEAAAWRAGQRP